MIPGDFQIKRPTRRQMILTSVLGIGGLVTAVVVVIGLTWIVSAWFGTPIIFGSDEGPDQPIDFPHTTHVQDLGLDCTFCHREVTKSAQATIPAVGLCMTCHQAVAGSTESAQAEIKKLRDAFSDGDAIDWLRVHRVPGPRPLRSRGPYQVLLREGRRGGVGGLFDMPRRRCIHGEGPPGADSEDERLCRLPPRQQRSDRLHNLPLLGI